MRLLTLLTLAAALTACQGGSESISVAVYPAVLAVEADSAAAAWDTVAFTGSERAPAGVYRRHPEALLTEWNIVAFRAAGQPDGTQAVTARLNAFAARQLSQFTDQPANLKKPLLVLVNGRCTDVVPVLGAMSHQFTFYGLRPAEVKALQAYLDAR